MSNLTQNLSIGSKGEDVKKVQTFLGITADGDFGPNTNTAVKEYQSENGLTADGVVGQQTWASMGLAEEEEELQLDILPPKQLSVNLLSSSDRPPIPKPILFTPKKPKKPRKISDFISLLTNNQNVAMEKVKIRLEAGLALLKQRALDEIAFELEKLVPITLPFQIRPILQESLNKVDGTDENAIPLGQFLDDEGNLVEIEAISTLNYIQSLPVEELNKLEILSLTRKQLILEQIESLEENLSLVITTKNTLYSGLVTITSTISGLENITDITDKVMSVAKTGITAAKLGALGIPTAPFPITAGVITGISDAIKILGDLVKENEGKIKPLESVVEANKEDLIPIVEEFSTIDPFVGMGINFISFIKLLLKYPGLTQQDIDLAKQETTTQLQSAMSQSPGPIVSVSDSEANAIADKELQDSLDPNSTNPLIYRGFKLIIEFDPNNTFSIPARRIKGKNSKGIIFYSVPPDTGTGEINTSSQYSFTTSTQVLLEEVKFNIDQWYNSLKAIPSEKVVVLKDIPDFTPFLNSPITQKPTTSTSGTNGSSGRSGNSGLNPFGTEGSIHGQVRFRGGQAWRWLGGSENRWVKHTTSFAPFNRKGGFNGEEKIQEDSLYANKYRWSEVLYKWEFKSREILRKF